MVLNHFFPNASKHVGASQASEATRVEYKVLRFAQNDALLGAGIWNTGNSQVYDEQTETRNS